MKNNLQLYLLIVLSALIYTAPVNGQITPPYFDDFENGQGGWTVFTASGSSWQLGIPTFGVTNSTHSGQNAWDIELNAAYQNNTQTILYSPVFDLSNATPNLMLMFWINYRTETAWDGANIQVSINQGPYSLLEGPLQGLNWYTGNVNALGQQGWSGLSQGWKLAYLPVGSLAGNSIVQFRFVFASDASVSDVGFTMDDFMLYDPLAIDAALTKITLPEQNSPAGSLKPVIIELANFGTTPMTSYDIYYSVNGGPQVIQSFTQTINPSSQFVFNLSPMIIPSGPFTVEAGVILTGDNNLLNNTSLKSCNGVANSMTMVNLTSQPNSNVCQFPYVFNDVLTFNTTGFSSLDTIHIYANYGTGITQHYTLPCSPFPQSINYPVSFTYLLPGLYSVKYIAYVNNQLHADTITLNNIVFLSSNCATVSGKVYVDANSNCVFDAGDTEVPNMMLQISAAGTPTLLTPTDQNGDYQFLVPTGYNYTVELIPFQAFSFACPASGIISNITSIPTIGRDFALTIVPGIDLAVTGYNTSITPGQNMIVTIIGRNNMATPVTGTVALVFDSSVLSYNTATPPPNAINGDTLFWDTDTLSFFHFLFDASVEFQVIPGSLNPGDSVCFYYRIDPFAGDIDLSNNELYRCRPAMAFPFDPNDKEVDKPEAIQAGEELIYRIRFQNTGTAPAINVSILDTLSGHLVRSSLRVLQSSHPMDFHITPQGILKFIFNNIMLPDSNSNEPGSHGHIIFSIKAKSNLFAGSVITNRAGIIFDTQDAVITNSTYNFIPQPTGMNQPVIVKHGAAFFPSPVSDILNIRFDDDMRFSLQIKNTEGRICYSTQSEGQSFSIPVNMLSNGIYTITVTTEKFSVTEKIVVSSY